jgi:predicted secreted protein
MAIGDPSQAMIGYGSRFQIYSGLLGSPAADWTDLGEVYNITAPSSTVDMVDVTHMQSPGGRREFVPGLIDPGECSFEMNFIPGSDGDLILLAILDQEPSERVRNCRIVFPNDVMWTFQANLMTYEPSAPTDDKMTANVSFKVTGLVTRSVFTG